MPNARPAHSPRSDTWARPQGRPTVLDGVLAGSSENPEPLAKSTYNVVN